MAITIADQASGAANFPPSSIAYNSAASIGDLLVCAVVLFSNASPGTQHITDSVNAGNWTPLNSQEDAGSTTGLFLYYKVVTTAGTPTVSISETSDQFGNIYIARFTGFTGTITADTSLTAKFAAASTTAVACTPVTTNQANELLLAAFVSNPAESNLGATVSGWNQVNGSTFGGPFYYAIVPTSGTNNGYAATLGAAAPWQMVFGGVFGSAPAGAALAGASQDIVSSAGALTTGPAPFKQILLDDPSHSGGSDQIYMGTGVIGTGDSAPVAFPKLKQWAADVNAMMSHLFPSRSVQTPTTGFSIAAATGVTQLILNPAGTLASGTVTLPQNPGDNQSFTLMTSQTVTALTANTADGSTLLGAPSTITSAGPIKWVFNAALTSWFRV